LSRLFSLINSQISDFFTASAKWSYRACFLDEKSVPATIPANKDFSSGKKRRIRNDKPYWHLYNTLSNHYTQVYELFRLAAKTAILKIPRPNDKFYKWKS